MNKIDKELIEELKKYFGAEVVGSYVFYEKGLLGIESINDIDICNAREGVSEYLRDRGYSGVFEDRYGVGMDGEQITDIEFAHEEYLPIHLIVTKQKVKEEHEIIAYKFKRGKWTDYQQIIEICENLKNKKK